MIRPSLAHKGKQAITDRLLHLPLHHSVTPWHQISENQHLGAASQFPNTLFSTETSLIAHFEMH